MTLPIISLSGFVMATYLKSYFRLSGNSDLPAYPGFIVMKIPIYELSLTSLSSMSILLYYSLRPVWMVKICWDTAESILSSSLLNSSKQPHAPTWHKPTKILPIAFPSKVSSQLNTRTNLPSYEPSALTDSVFPVPAGPNGEPPILQWRA